MLKPFARSFEQGVIGAVALLALVAGVVQAREFDVPRAEYNNPRFFGMGGAFAAVSNDRNLFFTNPAGLTYARTEIGFEFLPIGINNNSIRAISFLSDNIDTLEDLDILPNDQQSEFFDLVLDDIGGKRSELNAHFPIWVLIPAREGLPRPSLAFGFFARGGTDFVTLPGASGVPTSELNIAQQYTGVVTAAYAWDTLLPGKLSTGVSLKVDHRRLSMNSKSLLALSEDEDIDFLSDTVFGFDLGAMYDINSMFRVGAALFDVVSSDFKFEGNHTPEPLDILRGGDTGDVETSLVLGGAFHTPQMFGPLAGLIVSADVRDPFDGERSFWKSIHIGAESKLSFLTARFGFFEGYPGGGFGLGPLQYAYYGAEAGSFPGARSNYSHVLSFAFSFGL